LKPRSNKHFNYYFYEDLAKLMKFHELKRFLRWIAGQTVGVVNKKIAYYSWDVDRFLELVREGKQTYFD
jgi:hypothetical protein